MDSSICRTGDSLASARDTSALSFTAGELVQLSILPGGALCGRQRCFNDGAVFADG